MRFRSQRCFELEDRQEVRHHYAIGFLGLHHGTAGTLAPDRGIQTPRSCRVAALLTWRMPVRKVRLQYILGCPVYFFRKPQVYKMLEDAGFEVVSCETIGKLFCVEARIK